MAIQFTRTIRVSNVLTDADSMPTISIVRLDTAATVIATTTTGVTNPSTGRYSYTLAAPVPGVNYRATWTFLLDGNTVSSSSDQDVSTGTGTASGHYADSDDLYDRYGNNITQWSNLDNSDVMADDARIQRALDHADTEVDVYFSDGRYTIPFVGYTAADSADLTLRHWAATIAAAWLYHSRGQQDTNAIGDKLVDDLDNVKSDMALHRAGVRSLGATLTYPSLATGPVAV